MIMSLVAIKQSNLGKDQPGDKGQLVAPGDGIQQPMHLHPHQRRQTTSRQRPMLLTRALQVNQLTHKALGADVDAHIRRREDGLGRLNCAQGGKDSANQPLPILRV